MTSYPDAVRTVERAVPGSPGEAQVVLAAEQLRTGTEWVESGHVRLRRRIVSETRTIEVVVRREELVIETLDVAAGAVGESYRGTALDGAAVPGPAAASTSDPARVVVLLREEIPEVLLRPQVYQRITAELVTVNEMAVWHDNVRLEEAVLETKPAS